MKPMEVLEFDAKNDAWFHAYLLLGQNEAEINNLIEFVLRARDIAKEDISDVRSSGETGKSAEIGVDEIRSLLHEINLTPSKKYRVAIIRDCDKLNQSSGNILLKSLEEPAKSTMFVLTSTTESILSTIKSRCRIIRVPNKLVTEEAPQSDILAEMTEEGFCRASKKIDEIIKNNQIDLALNDLSSCFREKMIEKESPEYSELIKIILNAKKDISGNASPKLTLENLVLKIERVMK